MDAGRLSQAVHVLVVEDDPDIAHRLVEGLHSHGYHTRQAGSGAEALAAGPVDVVLLDLGLPDIDGVVVCRELRSRSETPILVVTARDEERDKVAALDLGADDYLVKPFGLAELAARVRAVLRRALPDAVDVYQHGSLIVEGDSRRVTVSGREIALTGREFDILKTLAAEQGRVVSREEIYSRVWDEHWYGPTKVLDVHIAALRRKLGEASLIQTVYGRGFRLGGG